MIEVIAGDCLEALPRLPAESVDSIVTDPPAGISFMGKDWDGDKGGRDQWIAWMQSVASECLRVAKPGAHALVWALPRTSHWAATAWENSGWEVRDRIAHLFGVGFPKSLDVSYAIDDHFFHEWLRAHPEHAVRLRGLKGEARKEVETELRRIAGLERKVVGLKDDPRYLSPRRNSPNHMDRERGVEGGHGEDHRAALITASATPEAAQWAGWGTALKPACEDWWLLRKPLGERTVAANVLAHGTGVLNIDACRIPANDKTPAPVGQYSGSTVGPTGLRGERDGSADNLGRWPANICHDGSQEVLAAFAAFGESKSVAGGRAGRTVLGVMNDDFWESKDTPRGGHTDSGTAARFFYSAKASKVDRADSKHPTVKPVSLIEYLCRLVTPPGGTVLDPFAGSGPLVPAARKLGVNAILIEREPEYIADIERRIANDTEAVQRKDKPPAPPPAGSPPTLFDAIAVGG